MMMQKYINICYIHTKQSPSVITCKYANIIADRDEYVKQYTKQNNKYVISTKKRHKFLLDITN